MNDRDRELLQDLIDGTLDESRRAEAEDLAAADDEARRFVAEHRALWAALGEAFDRTGVRPDGGFRQAVEQKRQSETPQRVMPLRRVAAIAAVILASAVLYFTIPDDGQLTGDDLQVVRYLHVLEPFDAIGRHGRALDLRYDVEVLRAFEGELEGEG
jgi:anti-sigma factor RsiW